MEKDFKLAVKEINIDWQNAFPNLSLFSQNKLYKILGPLIVGLELIKLPRMQGYRPYFVIYTLWGNRIGNDLKACLSGPLILKEYYNKKGLQVNIPFEKHKLYFEEVLMMVRSQTPISFEEDISFIKMLSIIDEYSNTSQLYSSSDSYFRAFLEEEKLNLALYQSNSQEIANIIDHIRNRKWNLNNFELCKINFNDWFNGLVKRINHREEFINQIELNKHDKKILKLPNNILF